MDPLPDPASNADRPSGTEGRVPDAPGADGLLREALRAIDASADRGEAVVPDPSRVAGHWLGVGDADLLRAAAEHPAVRRLLSDLAAVVSGAEADVAGAAESRGEASARASEPAASPLLLARAMAAFDEEISRASAPSDPESGVAGARPIRVLPPVRVQRAGTGRAGWRTWRVAAAVVALLVPVGVLSFVGGRAEAGPLVAIEGFERVGFDGAVATEGPRRLGLGATVSGLPGERLALRMAGGGRLVLPGEDVVRVACDGARCGRALFALDRGEVLLAVAGEGAAVEPVGLRLPRGERFDLLAGAARVRLETGDRVVVILRGDAVARWTPASGGARDLRGAGTLVLEDEAGPVVRPESPTGGAGEAEASFRDLEFFGGARREASPERRVGARRWRIVEDGDAAGPAAATAPARGRARRSDGSGVPAIRLDLPRDGRVRLAWQPDEPALLSRRVVVHLRAAAPGGPTAGADSTGADSTGAGGRLRVELEGVPGASAEVELAPSAEAAALDLELRLPDAWAAGRPAGAELRLAVTAGAAPTTVWFECAGFDRSEGPAAAPTAGSSEGASPRRGE